MTGSADLGGAPVLVTGATGFTGGVLARKLADSGARVAALAREGRDTTTLESAGIGIRRGDLRNPEALAAACRGIDTVYHIAATYRQEGIPRQEFFDVNVGGTLALLAAARDAGVRRFVHCSTVGVQGEIENPPADEEAPFRPGDIYQETKAEAELKAREFFASCAMEGVVFRPVGIYGPGDTRFLKLFKGIARGRFVMIGSGKVLYHLTYVDDLAEGIILCGTHPAAPGRVYTLGGSEYGTLSDLVGRIARVLDRPNPRLRIPVWPVYTAGILCEMVCTPLGIEPPLYRRRVDFFRKDRAFDIGRARAEMGYAPRIGLDEGLARTAAWYRQEGLL
jgi:nucleoside-diphosphate-sugar epimerase